MTLTAVKPTARFGAVKIRGSKVTYFKKKSSIDVWINGGFMVINSKFFNFIRGDNTYLEREPLEKTGKNKKIIFFQI